MRASTLLATALVAILAAAATPALAQAAAAAPRNSVQDAGPRAGSYRIWTAAPVPATWPVVFAAVPPNTDYTNRNSPAQDPDTNVYTWTFSSSPGAAPAPQACTVGGIPYQSPCVGKVVEYTFNGAGTFDAVCTVTPASGGTPTAVLTARVMIAAGVNKARRTVRREFRDMPPADWNKWVSGVLGLKAIKVWDHLALIHANTFLNSSASLPGSNPRSVGHSSPAFLTWHRAYLRIIERLIQKFVMDDTLGLPYWDWTIDAAGGMADKYPDTHPNAAFLKAFVPSKQSPVSLFTDRWVGPNGDPAKGNGVPSGPFCAPESAASPDQCKSRWNLPAKFQLGTTVLIRTVAAEPVKLPTPDQVNRILGISTYDTAPYESKWTGAFAKNAAGSFRGALEGWTNAEGTGMHNDMHRYIGGIMLNVRYSILDPVFTITHNNVERIFQLWQQKQNCFNTACFRPRQQDLDMTVPGVIATQSGLRLRGHMLDDNMEPWRVRHADVWGDANSNSVLSEYSYANPRDPAPTGGDVAAAPSTDTRDAVAPSNPPVNAAPTGIPATSGSNTVSGAAPKVAGGAVYAAVVGAVVVALAVIA
ncbi:hypothetical protein H9P43_009345 [Blastocladiella emersonii ATCC 22665]|nr:hypothetical protein H9P43_009345 [Blastocladiella emersonii ATCC 22665]